MWFITCSSYLLGILEHPKSVASINRGLKEPEWVRKSKCKLHFWKVSRFSRKMPHSKTNYRGNFYFVFDLSFRKYSCNLIPACSFLHVLHGGSCRNALREQLPVPIPWAQRVCGCLYLQYSYYLILHIIYMHHELYLGLDSFLFVQN